TAAAAREGAGARWGSPVRAGRRVRRDRERAHDRALEPGRRVPRDPGPDGGSQQVSAETHLEVYRPFLGKLRDEPLRFWPLTTTGLRTALKQRRALFVLYLPALIVTVILCFVVYIKFTAEGMLQDQDVERELDFQGQLVKGMVLAQAQQLLNVVSLILDFAKGMGGFALLAVAWFASGLFCEDKKAGAHQLYFARPITRLDYFLGKFLIASFFGLCAMLVPLFSV